MRCLLLVMCMHPLAKKGAYAPFGGRSEGHERYCGCNLMYRKVLASSHQHLMAEAPVARRVPQEKQTNSRPAPGPSPSSSIINHGERNHQGLGNAFVFLDTTVSAFFLQRDTYTLPTANSASTSTGRERGSTGSRSEQYDVQAISYGLGRISYLLLSSEARPHRTRTGMGQGYVLVSHSGTHLFHRIEATQSKARRQIVSDMTPEKMKKELERLQAENETLKKRSEKELSLKVSQKGGVSVYGLGRFPVTLYKEQWEKLLEMTDDIRAFIQENKAQLKTKDS